MTLIHTHRRSPHADLKTHLERLELEQRPQPSLEEIDEDLSDRDVDQTAMEQELIGELGTEARMQHHQDVSRLQGRIPTRTELQREFDALAAIPGIPFEYILDGCYARAHLMCEKLHQDEVNSAKMFVILDNPREGRLEADNKYMHASWWYHVAPMVFARDEQTGRVEPYIMDPSMATHPLPPQEWVHQMWDEETPIKIDVTRDAQYGPFEEDGANQTFEQSLEPAHHDLEEYTRELKAIKEKYCHEHPGECPGRRPAHDGYLIAA